MAELSYFILVALLGGAVFTMLESRSWADLRQRRNVGLLGLASIGGLAWYLYYPTWGLPSAIVAFIFGWFAPSFFEGLANRLRRG